MTETLTTELKSDLESIYKLTGELIDMISMKGLFYQDEMKWIMEDIKVRLMDIGSMLKKDILNCDYILAEMKTPEFQKSEVKVVNAYLN